MHLRNRTGADALALGSHALDGDEVLCLDLLRRSLLVDHLHAGVRLIGEEEKGVVGIGEDGVFLPQLILLEEEAQVSEEVTRQQRLAFKDEEDE